MDIERAGAPDWRGGWDGAACDGMHRRGKPSAPSPSWLLCSIYVQPCYPARTSTQSHSEKRRNLPTSHVFVIIYHLPTRTLLTKIITRISRGTLQHRRIQRNCTVGLGYKIPDDRFENTRSKSPNDISTWQYPVTSDHANYRTAAKTKPTSSQT